MVFHNLVLTTSKTLVLELDPAKADSYLPSCSLEWRNKQLWVKATKDDTQDILPALKHREWLKECLQNSIVEQVYLDWELGVTGIKLWADVCRESKKQVFLHIPSQAKPVNEDKLIYFNLKKIIDWWLAGILLLLVSPLMLIVAILTKIANSDSILVTQWRVGNQGKLFKAYKFRITLHHQQNKEEITFLSKWLQKLNLEQLPQFINVWRGEMVLFGYKNMTLSQALSSEKPDDFEVYKIVKTLAIK